MIGISPPAAHKALKELYDFDVLKREIIGKQHIYKLNIKSRIVLTVLKPLFQKELSIKEDIFDFLRNEIKIKKIKNKIISMILYGSYQTEKHVDKSDVDIMVVANNKENKNYLEKIFLEAISDDFYEYFGVHLDIYINSKDEFVKRRRNALPSISTMMQSYTVIFGEDPLDIG